MIIMYAKFRGARWPNAGVFRPYRKPNAFDLVNLIVERNDTVGKRIVTVTGWWTGNEWDGRRLRCDDDVKRWEKCEQKYM